MPASEAHLDAPRALRRVVYRGSFTDHLGGVAFVDGVAQSGMPERVLRGLLGIGLPLVDLGPWEAPSPDAAPPAAIPDAPAVSPAHAAPPAPSPSRHNSRR